MCAVCNSQRCEGSASELSGLFWRDRARSSIFVGDVETSVKQNEKVFKRAT